MGFIRKMKDIRSPAELSTRFMQYLIEGNIPPPSKLGIPMRKLGALIGCIELEMLDEGLKLKDEIREVDTTFTDDDIRGSATMVASLCVGYLLGKNPETVGELAELAYKITEGSAELTGCFTQYLAEGNILPSRKLGIPMHKLGALIGCIELEMLDEGLEDKIRKVDATLTDDDIRDFPTMMASIYVGCLLGKNHKAIKELAESAYKMADQG